MRDLFSKDVTPENSRFFNITQVAYILGASGHLLFGLLFIKLEVPEMVMFNLLFSVPAFTIAFFLNRKGKHNIAFSLGFSELLAHQVFGTYYLGWESGLYFWLIYLIGLSFFNAYWSNTVRVFCFSMVSSTFLVLYLFFRNSGVYTLSESTYNALYLMSSLSMLLLLAILIHYYVQAAVKAETNLKMTNFDLYEKKGQLEQALSERNNVLKQLNQELKEAADYVRSILPPPITEGNIRIDWRFLPSTSLGGDAFGYQWLDPDHFVFYLIDVSGHGVGAALLSVSVINALRSQSLPDTDLKEPEKVMRSLNHAFPGEQNNDMFFTMWYGVYHISARELTYASAGHPPALFFDDSNSMDSPADLLRTPNIAIGGLPDIRYKTSTRHIGPNTNLFVFSDGVYEIEKRDGAMWRFTEFTDFMNTSRSDVRMSLNFIHDHALNLGRMKKFEDDFTIMKIDFI